MRSDQFDISRTLSKLSVCFQPQKQTILAVWHDSDDVILLSEHQTLKHVVKLTISD